MEEIRVSDSEMCVRWNNKAWSIYRRFLSWDSLGEYRLREKWQWTRWVIKYLGKREFERSETGEVGEGCSLREVVTWWATWRRSYGRQFHNTGAEWWKDLFAMLRREVRERRLCVIREGRKKRTETGRLTSFERFICERTLYLILSFILSQWRDFRIGVRRWHLWV